MSNIEYRGLDSTERGAELVNSGSELNVPIYSNNPSTSFPLMGTGLWKREIYDLQHFCYPSDFCFSNWCCCGFITVAHLAEKTKAFQRWIGIRGIIAAFLIFTMILYDIRSQHKERVELKEEDIDKDGKIDVVNGFITPDGMFPFWIFFSMTLIVWKLRYTVRKQRGIVGSDAYDCCLSFFCSQCVIMQMAYQVYMMFKLFNLKKKILL